MAIRSNEPGGVTPNLNSRNVVGVFDRIDHAESAARDLHRLGYTAGDISVVSRGPEGTQPEYGAEDTRAGTGGLLGAGAGAVVGGALALVALAIPGVGPILAAGPIAAALSGAAGGAAMGSVFGSIAGLGWTTEHANRYENAIRSGGVVVAVRAPDHAHVGEISRLLSSHGARDLADFNPAL
jgi:hypothetical protein